MSIPVTRTKVILPRRRSELLTRQRLIDLLYELLDFKLIIIAAPAGYGKTSLLVDFAQQSNYPVCWYALDGLDRDPLRFIAHFIASIEQRFPEFGAQSNMALEAASQTKLDLDRLVAILVNDAFEHIREHFLVVLDDYHLVNEHKDIEYFVNRFIQDVDENCHLVLSSRMLLTIPDLPLLVARSQVGGLSFEELAFQAGEIQTLVLQNYQMTMPMPAAEELVKETEGWITGLLLSAQTMWRGMADRLRLARVSGVGLYDYLAQQVLAQQPEEVRDFLLRSSFLEEFDAELCRDVWGDEQNWDELIELVLQSNLFVLPVGEDGRWIRYHHLFRDFLQARLGKERPEEKQKLLSRLVDVYADRFEWEKAHAASLRLGDANGTAGLIERAGSELIKSGQRAMLAEWIDSLPAEQIAARPNLQSLRGVVHVLQGQVEKGLEQLNLAASAQRLKNDQANLARTLVRRSNALQLFGRYHDSLADAYEVLEILGESKLALSSLQAEAFRSIGVNLLQVGQLNEAIEYWSKAYEIFSVSGEKQSVALVVMELGLASMSAGRYQQALNYYTQALLYWRETKNSIRQAAVLNNLGVLNHLMGNYEQALPYLEEALHHARQNFNLHFQGYVLCSIGDMYADLDAYDASQDAFRAARDLARQINGRFLLFYADLAEAALARHRQDYEQAETYLQSARQLSSESSSLYEQGLIKLEMGRLLSSRHQFPEALPYLEEAASAFEHSGRFVEAARANLHLAAAQNSAFGLTLAALKLEQAFRLASQIDSPHLLVVSGREAKKLLRAGLASSSIAEEAGALYNHIRRFEENIPALRRRLRPSVSSVPFAPPKLTIRTLGRSQVERDGQPVSAPEWQNQRKAREFFFFLLCQPEGLSKEAIGLVFWPDSSAAQLKLQFKNTIYRLRHALGQDVILFDEYRYWFNRSLDYEYDVENFLGKIGQAKAAKSTAQKKAALRAALELYKGPFFPEAEGSWVLAERERLRHTYMESALALSRLHLESGEYGAALEYLQSVLAQDRCMEEAHRMAMRVYAAQGNRAALTRQFQSCSQALREEYGAQPSRQTENLYITLIH